MNQFIELSNFQWWIIILCLIGFVYTFFRALKFNNKLIAISSITLHLLLFAFLALLGLKPAIKKEQKKFNTVIVTKNYDDNELEKTKANPSNKFLYYFDLDAISFPDTIGTLLSIDSVLAVSDSVILLGDALPQSEWSFLNNKNIQLRKSTKTNSGIISIGYSENCAIDETYWVTGKYRNQSNYTDTLIFKNYLGQEEKQYIQPDTTSDFHFTFDCTNSGIFENSLTIKSHNNQEKKHILPVEVFEAEDISICILGSFPTFENKFLMEYLAEQGHKIYARFQISKDKFKEDFINQKSFQYKNLNTPFLNKTDMLILDVSSISNLTETEKSNLLKAAKNGLGVLVLADNKMLNFQDSKLLPFQIGSTGKSNELIKVEGENISLDNISHFIKKERNVNAILKTTNDKILGGFKNVGIGKIALLLYSETYQLKLMGKEKAYQSLWKKIIQKIIRNNLKNTFWTSMEQPIFKNQRSDLMLVSNELAPVGILEKPDKQKIALYLAQDFHIAEKWNATHMFADAGWHYLFTKNDTVNKQAIYIQDKSQWNTLLSFENQLFATNWLKNQKAENIKTPQNYEFALIPRWIFVLGVILAYVGIWWIERK